MKWVLPLRCWQMSLSWKVLPSWLLQLKRLRLKDDRIYTAKDKHFRHFLQKLQTLHCSSVLSVTEKLSAPYASPAASPSLLSCQGWSPEPALQLQDHKDMIPGCFTAQEEAHGKSEHLASPHQPRVGFTTLGKQKSWKHSTAAIQPEICSCWSWGTLWLHFCKKTCTRLGETLEKQGRWRLLRLCRSSW